ncbi:hypothetical protein ACIGO8_33130 [Streptomyces sp. NPDC053493]|uniref:hypothetical protein n=1 Tax=Streptomyces sp. NPDC053493 TaxID=3365705 RepID=UPI0037D86019
MADSLHAQYMKAASSSRAHGKTCTTCSPNARCDTGQRLYESFARLQDAYLAKQRERRG